MEPPTQKETKVPYKDPQKHAEAKAAWRKKNADRVRAYNVAYYASEQGKKAVALARARKLEYDSSPEGQAAKLAWQMQLDAWAETRAERKREASRRQRHENGGNARRREKYRAEMSAAGKAMRRSNLTDEERKEMKAEARRNRRARERSAVGKLSRSIRRDLYSAQQGRCPVCKEPLRLEGAQKCHIDHVVPLAAGGTHTDDNVQLLCPNCNVSKGAKDPLEFMQSKGFLL